MMEAMHRGTRARLRILAATIMVSGVAVMGSSTGWAQEKSGNNPTVAVPSPSAVAASIAPVAKQRFADQEATLALLRADPSFEAQLKLARMLHSGLMLHAGNPLRKKQPKEAERVLRALIPRLQGENRAKAEAALARVLAASDDPAERGQSGPVVAHAAEVMMQTFADGAAVAVIPANVDEALLRAELTSALDRGRPEAAFALAQLSAGDAASADRLRQQGVFLLAARAGESISAAIALGNRYLNGAGVPKDDKRAVELYRAALKMGSGRALGRLDDMARARQGGLSALAVKPLVVEGLSLGIAQAAEIVANDLLEQSFYGFEPADSLHAIGLLSEIEDRRSLLMAAKVHLRGLNGRVNIEAAKPFLEALADVKGLPLERRLRVASELMKLPLPPALAFRYAAPILADAADNGSEQAALRLARLLLANPTENFPPGYEPGRIQTVQLLEGMAEKNWDAAVLLGDMYRVGASVPLDLDRAAQLYQKAVDLGANADVKEKLAKTLNTLKETRSDLGPFWRLVEELAATNNPWAMKILGAALLQGDRSLLPDPARGVDLLRRAYAGGYLSAGDPLAKFLARSDRAQDLREAETLFRLIWIDAPSLSTGLALAELSAASGKVGEAEEVLLHPTLRDSHRAAYALAKLERRKQSPNNSEAFAHINRALTLSKGEPELVLRYARFMFSIDLPEAKKLAAVLLEPFANRGDPRALVKLIPYYLASTTNDDKILGKLSDWILFEAKMGGTSSATKLGRLLLREKAPKEQQRIAFELLKEVHQLVPSEYQVALLLADAYQAGFGTAVDLVKAREMMRAAARSGARDAQVAEAQTLLYGINSPRDPRQAMLLLERAAAQSSDVARQMIARMLSGSDGPEFNPQKAFAYFHKAASGGSPPAMLELGLSYLAGSGVAPNKALGVKWLQRSADAGLPDAAYQLYFYYSMEDGEDSDAVALRYLKRAAEKGILPAKLRYAVHLRLLDPVKFHKEIISTLKSAVAAGHNSSRRYLLTHYPEEG